MSAAERIIPSLETLEPRTHLMLAALGTGDSFRYTGAFDLNEKKECEISYAVRDWVKKVFGCDVNFLRTKAIATSVKPPLAANSSAYEGDGINLKDLEFIARPLAAKTGHPIEELVGTLAQAQREENRARIGATLSDQIVGELPFLNKYVEGNKLAALSALGKTANDFINWTINRYFPEEMEHFGIRNTVANCNNAGELTLLAFDETQSKVVRFEAARKLFLMVALGEIQDYALPEIVQEGTLLNILGFFDERIISVPEDGKLGDTVDKYVVSFHSKENYEVLRTVILDSPDQIEAELAKSDEIKRVTHAKMKKAMIPDKEGNLREINFLMHVREKTLFSRLLKALKYGSHIGVQDVDVNGLQLVCENADDWEDLFNHMITQKLKKIEQNYLLEYTKSTDHAQRVEILDKIKALQSAQLIKVKGPDGNIRGMYLSNEPRSQSDSLEETLDNPDEFFQALAAKKNGKYNQKELEAKYADTIQHVNKALLIYEVKDNIKGDKEFVGSGNNSNKDLEVYKLKMESDAGEGKVDHVEIQASGFGGHLNSKLKKGVAWDVFDLRKFFEIQDGQEIPIHELLFPPHIYDDIDRKAIFDRLVRRMEKIHWNGHSNAEPNEYKEREAAGQLTLDLY